MTQHLGQTIVLAGMFFAAAYLGYVLGRNTPRHTCKFCDEEGHVLVRVGQGLVSTEVRCCDNHHKEAWAFASNETEKAFSALAVTDHQGIRRNTQ